MSDQRHSPNPDHVSNPKLQDHTHSNADPNHSTVVSYPSMAEFFHEALRQACDNQGFETSEETEFYVVQLLEEYAQADRLYGLDDEGKRCDEALAMMLSSTLSRPYHRRMEGYRRLGDVALFVSGFFSDSLRRRSVGVSYYVGMGQGAYASAADLMRSGSGASSLRSLFGELAGSFSGWVDVLREISESSALSASLGSLRISELVRRYHAAQSPGARTRLAGELLKRGVWVS